LLGFDSRLRLLLAFPLSLCWLLSDRFRAGYWLMIFVSVAVLSIATIGYLERVEVRGRRNLRYCRCCRYDLAGTIAAGIAKCPECGYAVPAVKAAAKSPTA